jgi:hypothetical protein
MEELTPMRSGTADSRSLSTPRERSVARGAALARRSPHSFLTKFDIYPDSGSVGHPANRRLTLAPPFHRQINGISSRQRP